jgi:hypothetical protein
MNTATQDDEFDELWKRRHRVLYRIELSVLYHRKRERFLDTVDRLIKTVALIGGSAAIAKASDADTVVKVGVAVALTSAASLVFAFSERARRHAEFARSFGELAANLLQKGEHNFAEEDLDDMDAKVRHLESTEPATLGALVVICQNELAVAQDHPEYVRPLPLHQRMLAHLWDFRVPPAPTELVNSEA